MCVKAQASQNREHSDWGAEAPSRQWLLRRNLTELSSLLPHAFTGDTILHRIDFSSL
jgi:hypothetical protein